MAAVFLYITLTLETLGKQQDFSLLPEGLHSLHCVRLKPRVFLNLQIKLSSHTDVRAFRSSKSLGAFSKVGARARKASSNPSLRARSDTAWTLAGDAVT